MKTNVNKFQDDTLSISITFLTSSPHRDTRSAQRACRQAKDKPFESDVFRRDELFVF